MNRRTFFGHTIGAVVAIACGKRAPVIEYVMNTTGLQAGVWPTLRAPTCGSIQRSTFTFWRNKYPGVPYADVRF